jgi:drug/metabolite transporter (DMT)-like permease
MVEKEEHSTIGIAAVVLGILGILLLFLPWIGLPFRSDIVAIPLAILAAVFGQFARTRGDSYGIIGLTLGVITLLIMIVIITLTTPVYVESGPLR